MQNPSSAPIVLASSSKHRQALLKRFLDRFECVSPGVDESAIGTEDPLQLAIRLARQKAETVAEQHSDALVIGGDQVAVFDGKALGKPGSHQAALQQLLAMTGKSAQFITAVCVLDPLLRQRYEHVDYSTIHFRPFSRQFADAYLRRDQPYDCAGSFKIEGAGCALFAALDTDDPNAIIGLPMIWLTGKLLELEYLKS